MRYIADLHIHSRFSRATSPQLTPEQLWLWAQIKGIQLVATGDCIHPGWLAELHEKLEPAGDGLFSLKPEFSSAVRTALPAACTGPVRFILSTEISSIYKRDGKVRKVHNVLYMPDFAAADMLAAKLENIGNIRSDGRPILGLDSRDVLDILLSCNPDSFCIPAHIWTPWFSVLGSKSGFDSLEECFGDLTKYIYALETGLSSDPMMNWRLSSLDRFLLVSNSDAHSPSKLGREANIFDTEFSYGGVLQALRDPDDKGLTGTVEFFPEEGKYHYDGHRKCRTRMHPRDTIKNKGLCPVCGKPVTVGVMARVEELADRPEGAKGARWRPYHSLIPLPEIIGDCLDVGQTSLKAQQTYRRLVHSLGSEFSILLDMPVDRIEKSGGALVAEGVRRVRNGEVTLNAGYDGEYGIVSIFSDTERSGKKWQVNLFDSKNPPALPLPGAGDEEPVFSEDHKKKVHSGVLPQRQTGKTLARQQKQGIKADAPLKREELNQAQKAAVDHAGSHLCIIAGPGTGKTHTLTHKIVKTAGICAGNEKILAVTFTNKAAEEMRERISRRCDANVSDRLFIGTFHRFCLHLLRTHAAVTQIPVGFALASDRQRDGAAAQALPGSSIAQRRELLELISKSKASCAALEIPAEISLYNKTLRNAGLLDFDDLVLEAVLLISRNDRVRQEVVSMYRHIFVDEYQDVNPMQHELLKLCADNGVLITAIGDPNQAIYGFRGSDVRFFSSFERDFPGAQIVFLSDNYRTAANLLLACGHVISAGMQKSIAPPCVTRLYTEGMLTIFEAATDRAEAEYVVHRIEKLVGGTSMFSHDSGRLDSDDDARMTFSDFAVLYRTNSQSRLLIEAFDRSGIPYKVSGEKPLAEYPIVNDILALLHDAANVLQNTGVGAALLCLEARPGFGAILSDEKTKDIFNRLKRIARLHGDVQSFTDYIMLQQSDDGSGIAGEKVSLLTLHAAKGLEFPVVFITGCESGIIPLERGSRQTDFDEERRLFYVGMTRAKSRLYLMRALRRTLYGKTFQTAPSPYLADIKEDLKTYEKAHKMKKIEKKPESEQVSLFDML